MANAPTTFQSRRSLPSISELTAARSAMRQQYPTMCAHNPAHRVAQFPGSWSHPIVDPSILGSLYDPHMSTDADKEVQRLARLVDAHLTHVSRSTRSARAWPKTASTPGLGPPPGT